jgi:hypothetical protein
VMRRHTRVALAVVPLLALGLSACGTTARGKTATAGDHDRQLKFAQCMRKHGVDMPDPQFNGGGMAMRIGGPDTKRIPKATLDVAQRACQKIMQKVKPPTMSPEQQAKARKGALKMAQCMRERGFDVPDPQFGTGGRIQQRIGGPGSNVNPEDPRFQQAMETCSKKAGGPGGGLFKTAP